MLSLMIFALVKHFIFLYLSCFKNKKGPKGPNAFVYSDLIYTHGGISSVNVVFMYSSDPMRGLSYFMIG